MVAENDAPVKDPLEIKFTYNKSPCVKVTGANDTDPQVPNTSAFIILVTIAAEPTATGVPMTPLTQAPL